MSRRMVADAQESFAGGLNTQATDATVGRTQFRRGANGHLTERGAFTKRRGTQFVHASAIDAAVPVYGFSFRTSTVQELVVTNGKLFGATLGMPTSWSEIGTGGLNASVVPRFAHFRDGSGEVVYIADGGLLNKTNGSALTLDIASTPNVAVLESYNQRLFGASGGDSTLYASALNNGDTLGVTGSGGIVAVVRTYGGQRITALKTVGDALLIFHTSAISYFRGITQDDVAIGAGTRGISNVEGTIAPGSIVVVEIDGRDVALFLTSRGALHSVTPAGVQYVSRDLEDTLQSLNVGDWQRVSAVHHKSRREVWFYVPDFGVYVWQYDLRAWTGPFDGGFIAPATRSLWETLDSFQKPVILGGTEDGFVRRYDVPNVFRDNVAVDGSGGEKFAMVLGLRRLYCRTPDADKVFERAWVMGTLQGSVSVGFRHETPEGSDEQTLATAEQQQGNLPIWGQVTWGSFVWASAGVGGERKYEAPLYRTGPYVDITISDDAEAEVSISRVSVEAYLLGRR